VKKIALISTLALVGLASAALAQDQQEAPAPTPVVDVVAAAAQPEAPLSAHDAEMQEVRCRTSRVTGSRTRVNRVCMTRAEWEELEERNRENVEELQGRASGGAQCVRDSMGGCS
jgi:hypothetical protein